MTAAHHAFCAGPYDPIDRPDYVAHDYGDLCECPECAEPVDCCPAWPSCHHPTTTARLTRS